MGVSGGPWTLRITVGGMAARRGLARLVDDVLVVGVQSLSLLTGAILYVLAQGFDGEAPPDAAPIAVALAASGFVVGITYEIVVTRVGLSIGKLICGLRVVADTGRRLPLGRSIARWGLVSGVQPLGWLAIGLGGGAKTSDEILLASLVAAAVAWRGALAVSVLTGPEARQGLHDHLVRSAVVRARRLSRRYGDGAVQRAARRRRLPRQMRRRMGLASTAVTGPPMYQGKRRRSDQDTTVRSPRPRQRRRSVKRPSPVTRPSWRTPISRPSTQLVTVMRSTVRSGPTRVTQSKVVPTPR